MEYEYFELKCETTGRKSRQTVFPENITVRWFEKEVIYDEICDTRLLLELKDLTIEEIQGSCKDFILFPSEII